MKRKKQKELEESILRIISENSDFDTVETYKTIRTNIMFSLPKSNKGKVIVVTSAAPGEGKTTTSINLAITFAQTYAKVILVDADLRKARVHRYLQMDRRDGLSNLLCGFCDYETAIKKNVRSDFDIIPAGEIPPNPAELLETAEFSDLISRLQDEYDYVIIDTPPFTVVTDSLIVSKLSTGVFVAIKENETNYDLLDDTFDGLEKADAKIIGVITHGNVSKEKKHSYYKKSGKYGYRYSHRYGYKYKYDYRYSDEETTSRHVKKND